MKVCIVDYGMGNITSVANAVSFLGHTPNLVSDPELLNKSDFLILPGVGAFSEAMRKLKENGMESAILELVDKGKRILGICLGMQLLFSKSYEFGETRGLNIIDGDVLPFDKATTKRTPHMGWNDVATQNNDFKKYEGDYYFVHSYFCNPANKSNILFQTNYGVDFCSAVSKNDHIFGLQFHPEKSQKLGLALLNEILK